jgi:hypothetical protein
LHGEVESGPSLHTLHDRWVDVKVGLGKTTMDRRAVELPKIISSGHSSNMFAWGLRFQLKMAVEWAIWSGEGILDSNNYLLAGVHRVEQISKTQIINGSRAKSDDHGTNGSVG